MSNAAFSPDGGSLGFLRPDGTAATGPAQSVTLYAVQDLQDCITPGGAVRPPRSVPKRFLGVAAGAGADDESNLSLEEKLRRERQRSLHVGVTSFTWLPDGRALFPQRGSLCIAGAGEIPATAVDKTATGAAGSVLDAQPSKDGRWVAFVQEGEVYVSALPPPGESPAQPNVPVQVTHGARERGWTHGEADYLSQEELDRYIGLWWSPCGRYIAFQETDDTHVPPFRIVHVGAEPADSTAEEVHRYPFAGCARNPAVRLAIVDVSSVTCGAAPAAPVALPTRYLHLTDGDDADIYIPRVTWAPDSSLVVQLFNRPQTCSDLVRYSVAADFATPQGDAQPLKGTLLLREVAPKGWFNVNDCLKFLPAAGAEPSPPLFTWASERTGFLHLYLYGLPEASDAQSGYSGPLQGADVEAAAGAGSSSDAFATPVAGGAAVCLGALTWGEEWQVETLDGVTLLGAGAQPAASAAPGDAVTESGTPADSNNSSSGWGIFFSGTADGPLQRHCYRLALRADEVTAALSAPDASGSVRRLGATAPTAVVATGSPATFLQDSAAGVADSAPTFARSFGPSQPYPVPGMQRVTSGSGFHTVVLSPCGRFLADTLSSLHASPSLSLYFVPPFRGGAVDVAPAVPEPPAADAATTPTAAVDAATPESFSSGAVATPADAAITVAAPGEEGTPATPGSRSIADIAADSFANFIAFGAAKLEAAAAGFTSATSRAASRRHSAEEAAVAAEEGGAGGEASSAAADAQSGSSSGATGGAPVTGLARFAPQRVSLGALGAVSVSTLSAFAAFVSPPEAGNPAAADGSDKPATEALGAAFSASSSGASGDGGTDSSDDDEDGEVGARADEVAAAIDAAVAAVQANAAAAAGADEEPRMVRPHDISRVLAAVVPLAVSGPYGGSAAAGEASPCPGVVPIRLLMTCTGKLPQWTAGNPESLAATIEGLRARMMASGNTAGSGAGRGRSGSFGADAAAAAARAALSRVVSPVSAASAALLDSVSHAVSQVSSAVSEAATRLTSAGLPSPSEVVKAAVAAVKTSGNGGASGAGGLPPPSGSPSGAGAAPAAAAAASPAPPSPAPLLVETLAADGTTPLYGALYIPDERKWGPGPYPTVVSVYGGPHVQRVRMEWSATADARAQALARAGILVAKFDNRGSFRRGAAFERALRLCMGTVEVDDQAAGVRWLVDCGLADPAAVGLCGWSYGGYMTLMCLARRPDIFHVGASGAPVTDWAGYDTAYTERYMGTPQSNPAGYAEACVMTHVKGLAHSDLLLVHGLIDENVHVRHTYRLINAMTRARVPYTFLPFPNERHAPRGKDDLEYMEATIQRYLIDNLRRRAAEAAAASAARASPQSGEGGNGGSSVA